MHCESDDFATFSHRLCPIKTESLPDRSLAYFSGKNSQVNKSPFIKGEQLIFGHIVLDSKLYWKSKSLGKTPKKLLFHEPTSTILVIAEDQGKKHWLHAFHSDSFAEIFCVQFSDNHIPVDIITCSLFPLQDDFQTM